MRYKERKRIIRSFTHTPSFALPQFSYRKGGPNFFFSWLLAVRRNDNIGSQVWCFQPSLLLSLSIITKNKYIKMMPFSTASFAACDTTHIQVTPTQTCKQGLPQQPNWKPQTIISRILSYFARNALRVISTLQHRLRRYFLTSSQGLIALFFSCTWRLSQGSIPGSLTAFSYLR